LLKLNGSDTSEGKRRKRNSRMYVVGIFFFREETGGKKNI